MVLSGGSGDPPDTFSVPPINFSCFSSTRNSNLNLTDNFRIIQSAITNISTLIQSFNASNINNPIIQLLINTHIQILGFLITNNNNPSISQKFQSIPIIP